MGRVGNNPDPGQNQEPSMSIAAHSPHPDHAELHARRLLAQGLAATAARTQLRTAGEVARHMLALQGQTYLAGTRAIALRAGVDEAAVLAAVDKQEIVRAWPQRGTLHFLPAEDARWMMRLCSPRPSRAAAQRRPSLGISPADFARAREAFHVKLQELGGEPLPRPAAYEVFAAAGVDPSDSRGSHLLRAFGSVGDVVQGPKQGRHETFLLVDFLPVPQRELAGEEALAELGTRYFHSHGPATVKDLAWWSGLTVADAGKARLLARDVIEVDLAGQTYVMGAWQQEVTEAELAAALQADYLLPAFDEYLLGYGERSSTLPENLRAEVLTRNGLSWAFHVSGGVVTGRA